MKFFALIIPISLLIAIGQVLIKWRTQVMMPHDKSYGFFKNIFLYLSDIYIATAYLMALIGSFIWLMAIPRISLSIGFPIYIGTTFLFVMLGSCIFLNESLSLIRIIAVILILLGIILGGAIE
jgi:multidrug transporter EmrE-like cation transporter